MYGITTAAATTSDDSAHKPASSVPNDSCSSSSSMDPFRRIERSYRVPVPQHEPLKRQKRRTKEQNAPEEEEEEWNRWKSHTVDCRHRERNTEELNACMIEQPFSVTGSASSPSWISPTARLYSFSSHPGFLFLSRALSPEAQAWWSWKCLAGYSAAEHTNLTNLEILKRKEEEKKKRQAEAATDATTAAGESTQAAVKSVPTSVNSVSSSSSSSRAAPSSWSLAMRGNTAALSKLRWASLGYHYDWTSREYTAEARSQFPNELAQLSEQIARAVGFDNLKAEAAIVNYYPASGMMGAHVDDAELTKLQPIVSISLGCSAIFLLGGRTKDEAPVGFLVRSGDVVIMGGESRVCFHGVPRIIDRTFQSGAFADEGDPLEQYPDGKRRKEEEESKQESKEPIATKSMEWTPEQAVAALRQRPLASDASQTVFDFPSTVGSDIPTRDELLTTYRFLRHARLNLNVRQVEDEHFQYGHGMTSGSARLMAIEEQQRRAMVSTREPRE